MLAQYFPPDVNGPSTRAYNAAVGLTMQGCNVTVIAAFPHYPNGYKSKHDGRLLYKENIDGINVIRTWVPNLAHWPISRRLAIHISFMLSSLLPMWGSRHTDVIFAMNQNFFAFFPSLIYKILLNKHIIRNVDDLWPEVFYDLNIPGTRILRRVLDYAAWLSYRIPSAIIPVSEGYVPTLTTKYHIPKEKIHVIEHGVDTRRFDDHEFKTSTSKEGKKIIMYSGNLNIGYDFDIVFACAKLLELEPVHFIIRGTGELSEKLKQMVAEYGLENLDVKIELLSQKELNSVLSSAHVFLLPMSSVSVSADQGLPTKVLEYQALGRPIVCISDGEAGAYIARTQSGLVSKTRTPEELARLIMNLVNDESLAKKLGSNGFQHIRKNLTLDLIGKRIMSVITKC